MLPENVLAFPALIPTRDIPTKREAYDIRVERDRSPDRFNGICFAPREDAWYARYRIKGELGEKFLAVKAVSQRVAYSLALAELKKFGVDVRK